MIPIKQFKDPIYGYIKLPTEYVKNIIDTAEFQRLRRIVQTSYSPLYSASVHNRFIHSIGVYHLGTIACKGVFNDLKNNEQTKDLQKWDEIKKIFLLACLLHDVGHAPFSHTGEKYYLDEKGSYANLHKKLADCVGTDEFRNDIPKDSKSAAPHEIMSAIVALENYKIYFTDSLSRELFARCITGYKYQNKTLNNSVLNCIISLLNSKVIDVDRLDYLIRDAYFTGFETVNIDYKRLLTSLTITIEHENAKLGFNKNAISIIENVVYAHDSERKWIQTHPIVLYDMYIIQHVIDKLERKYSTDKENLFSQESLSSKGHKLSDGTEISLLCDDDIVHLLKTKKDDALCIEYFSRNKRRHPIWKSEAEYKAYMTLRFGKNGKIFENLSSALSETEKYMRKNSESWIINESIIEKLENDLKNVDESTEIGETTKKAQKEIKEKILKVIKALNNFASKNEIDCDFVLLEASQFYSGFNKKDLLNIPITFPQKADPNTYPLKDVVTLLESNELDVKEFFYLYYKEGNKPIDKDALCAELYKAFI